MTAIIGHVPILADPNSGFRIDLPPETIVLGFGSLDGVMNMFVMGDAEMADKPPVSRHFLVSSRAVSIDDAGKILLYQGTAIHGATALHLLEVVDDPEAHGLMALEDAREAGEVGRGRAPGTAS